MPDVTNMDERVLTELRTQTGWLRLLGLQALRPLLLELLTTEKQKAVYELSDGHRTVRQIAQAAGVGVGTVSRLWSEWLGAGICAETDAAGRARHLVPLSSLGISVNALSPAAKEEAPEASSE